MSEENNIPAQGTAHDKNNHTMSQFQEPKDLKLGVFDPKEDNNFIKVFLGVDSEEYKKLSGLISRWLEYNFTLNEPNAKPAQVNAVKDKYFGYLKEQYPNKTEEEVNELAQSYYSFATNFTENLYRRNETINGAKTTNVSLKAQGIVEGDIVGRAPGLGKKLPMRDMMRRHFRRTTNEAENFDVLLRNSFIQLRISRPTILELGRLLEDIQLEVKNYVRQVNGNSLTLARISIARVIWKFVSDRIVSCSVKDTDDYYDLANNILWSDFGALCISLLSASSSKGVNFQLECLANNCDWEEYQVIDPSLLLRPIPENLSEEQSIALGNIVNGVQRYSREEITKLQNKTKYDFDTKLTFDEGRQYFEIAPPTLSVAFETFDMFVDKVIPSIQQLRANTINDQEYAVALANLIQSIAGSEYAHWVKSYVINPESGTDGSPTKYDRLGEGGSREFNEGLFDILDSDVELSQELIKKINRIGPSMTLTIIGVPNYHCPRCAKSSSESGVTYKGITPIDPLMAFFTLTQLMFMDRVVNLSGLDATP